MFKFLISFLLLFSFTANAVDLTLTWEKPTVDVNGNEVTTQAGYYITFSTTDGINGSYVLPDPDATSVVITNISPGESIAGTIQAFTVENGTNVLSAAVNFGLVAAQQSIEPQNLTHSVTLSVQENCQIDENCTTIGVAAGQAIVIDITQ